MARMAIFRAEYVVIKGFLRSDNLNISPYIGTVKSAES